MQMINKVSCSQGYEFLPPAGAFQVILRDLLQTKTKNEARNKNSAALVLQSSQNVFRFWNAGAVFHISGLFKLPGYVRRSGFMSNFPLHLNASRALIPELQHGSLHYAT